ncbi:MAG TPA: YicC/YloC family endoribonuclease [Burkholderiales bacterium]|nr:YicC/YloC family endoribonuclease [Burkholderiales bacterium]
MIHSMTGYAVASTDTPRGTLSLELRSVNSRFLDLQFRVADELRALEPPLREMVAARLARGKVDCRLYFAAGIARPGRQSLNRAALDELARLAAQAAQALPGAGALRVADALRWPGVLSESALDEEQTRATVEQLGRRALDELLAARAREGARLAAIVGERVAEMRRRLCEVAPLVPEALAAYQEKLAQRLRDAIGSANDERIRTELAVFGMKTDVDEELTRLATHFDEVERTLTKGGAVGKRLDFLAQELNREANTLASKAATQKISDCALELKLLIEQMREQVQNIE